MMADLKDVGCEGVLRRRQLCFLGAFGVPGEEKGVSAERDAKCE